MDKLRLWISMLIFVQVANCEIVCPSSTIIDILGAGSQFPADFYQEVAQQYSIDRSLLGIKTRLTYESVSSGYGKERLAHSTNADNPVVFAASETLLTPEEEVVMRRVKTFPLVAGAIVIIANLPGLNASKVRVRFTDLPRIYMGEIVYWNDSALRIVNPNVDLPFERIQPVAYSSATGLTEAFTQAFGSINSLWKDNYGTFINPDFVNNTCCESTNWPRAVAYYGNRVTGVVGVVSSVPYTIGYISVASSQQYREFLVNILGSNDTLLPPTQESVQKAMDYYYQRNRGSLLFYITNAPGAYPLATFSYVMINSTTTPGVTCCQMREVVGLIENAMYGQADAIADKYGMAQLSATMAAEVQTILRGFTCNDDLVYSAFKSSTVLPSQLSPEETGGIIAAVLVFTLGLIGGSVLFFVMRKLADEGQWLIEGSALKTFDDVPDSIGESVSTVSGSDAGSSIGGKVHPLKFPQVRAKLEEKIVIMIPMPGLPYPRRWQSHTKRLLTRLKMQIVHDHIALLLGAASYGDTVYCVSLSAKKGTVHYVLQTCQYELDEVTKYSFGTDIAEAMDYLHSKAIVHGQLSSLTCYVEGSWSIKVAHWERLTILESQSRSAFLNAINGSVSTSEFLLRGRLVEGLYIDPEMLLDGHTKKTNDVYSFGLLLIEIFTRKLPFHENVSRGSKNAGSFQEVLMSKSRNQESSVMIPSSIKHDLRDTIDSCLRSPSSSRSSFSTILAQLRDQNTSSLGIVDVMMETLENHVKQLETTSKELNRVTRKMQDLLNEVLPPSIARKLFNDERVEPEHFDCVTVCFSDIVGFTTISSELTPLEVMKFLNDLWTAFDSVMDRFDVYKVDTIGDAYMVCSGLPERNGIAHVREIARMALDLIEVTSHFRIPNRIDHVRIRVGFNSGPVTAGVVGTKMPQYCVFGDTVNTANRLESTSQPYKCQISQLSNDLLQKHYPTFQTELRGEIEMKGKGALKTYWLLKEDRDEERIGLKRVTIA